MNLSVTAGTNALTALFALLNGGTLNLYTGVPPANVAATLSGNTLIGTADLAATALSGSITASGDTVVGTLAFTSNTFSTVAAGTITFARALSSASAAVNDFGASSAWLANTVVVLNQMASNGANVYICTTAGTTAASGGPTGTGSGITDGTAVWAYVQPGTASVTLNNVAVTQSLSVLISGATLSLRITNPVGPALVT